MHIAELLLCVELAVEHYIALQCGERFGANIHRKGLAILEAKPLGEVADFALRNNAACAHFGANIVIVYLVAHVNVA